MAYYKDPPPTPACNSTDFKAVHPDLDQYDEGKTGSLCVLAGEKIIYKSTVCSESRRKPPELTDKSLQTW